MKNYIVAAAGAAALLALPAFAAEPSLSAGAHLHCANTVGSPVVNVTEKVKNDADSGIAGNYWALDALERHITVWQTTTAGTYCAVVRDEGSFNTLAGQKSPGNTATLTGSERGEISGGYTATITGTLLTTPSWKTHGEVGTVNYQCDASGNCPGYVSWPGQYFASGFSFDQPWWGWIYRGGKFGTWVNAVSGNSGDIVPATSGAKGDKDSEHDD